MLGLWGGSITGECYVAEEAVHASVMQMAGDLVFVGLDSFTGVGIRCRCGLPSQMLWSKSRSSRLRSWWCDAHQSFWSKMTSHYLQLNCELYGIRFDAMTCWAAMTFWQLQKEVSFWSMVAFLWVLVFCSSWYFMFTTSNLKCVAKLYIHLK